MMTAYLSHTDSHTNVRLTLVPLSGVITHTGMDHVQQIEVRWGCTTIDMDISMAKELHDRLEDFL